MIPPRTAFARRPEPARTGRTAAEIDNDNLIPGMGDRDTPAWLRGRKPPARDSRGRTAAERDNDNLIPGMGDRDTPVWDRPRAPRKPAAPRIDYANPLAAPLPTGLGVLRMQEQATEKARTAPWDPTVPEWMKTRAAAHNRAMRQELSDEQFGALTADQQAQVRLNTALAETYDMDMARGSGKRGSTDRLIRSLGLDAGLESKLLTGLGQGQGPVSTLDEIGLATRRSPLLKSDTDRQKLVSALAGKLSTFIQAQDEAAGGQTLEQAWARKDEFKFDNDITKQNFEASFEFMLDPEGRSSLDWATAAAQMAEDGQDPEAFKAYAKSRLAMLPKAAIDTAAIDSWFGDR